MWGWVTLVSESEWLRGRLCEGLFKQLLDVALFQILKVPAMQVNMASELRGSSS